MTAASLSPWLHLTSCSIGGGGVASDLSGPPTHCERGAERSGDPRAGSSPEGRRAPRGCAWLRSSRDTGAQPARSRSPGLPAGSPGTGARARGWVSVHTCPWPRTGCRVQPVSGGHGDPWGVRWGVWLPDCRRAVPPTLGLHSCPHQAPDSVGQTGGGSVQACRACRTLTSAGLQRLPPGMCQQLPRLRVL